MMNLWSRSALCDNELEVQAQPLGSIIWSLKGPDKTFDTFEDFLVFITFLLNT